jgi:peptidoglycan/LPS O-acetylase OafA/YrhL
VADAGCWVTYTRLIMSRRIPQLDGLRALAIIAVFLGHALKIRMMWMGG